MDAALIAAAAGSGACFSANGIAMRGGVARGVPIVQLMLVTGAAGTAVFAAKAFDGHAWSATAVAFGALAGATQYATLPLSQRALRDGPLTALWCAMTLYFVPTVAVAWALGEPQRWPAIAACVAGVAAVVVGSRLAGAGAARAPALARLGVLIAAFVVNSASSVLMMLAQRRRLMAAHGDEFIVALYAAFLACLVLDLAARRASLAPPRRLLAWGALGAAGSIAGLSLMARALALPPAVQFPTTTCVSLIVTALVGTALFGERRTATWYATIGLAVAAVGFAACALDGGAPGADSREMRPAGADLPAGWPTPTPPTSPPSPPAATSAPSPPSSSATPRSSSAPARG